MRIYQLYGLNSAMQLLRPGAKWEINNGTFTRWDDERHPPSWEEILETMNKLKALEDSVYTVWSQKQMDELSK
jgi:hypothetical protein